MPQREVQHLSHRLCVCVASFILLPRTLSSSHGSIGNTGLSGPEVYATIWEDVGERRADDGKLSEWQHKCSQPGPLFPENSDSLSKMQKYIATEEFLEASARRVSGTVQVNTTSADGMQPLPGDDLAWNHIRPLSEFLEESFPLVHENLNLEKVDTHGLLCTWQGSNDSLKPTVLMAHQDVVPVESESENDWKHAPFSGHWDGGVVRSIARAL